MRAGARWSLILAFIASVALAVYAQHLFAEPDSFWYDSVLLYAVAMLLFVWVTQRALAASTPGVGGGTVGDLWSGVWAVVSANATRVVLITLAIVASLIAGRESNRDPHPESFTFAIFMWLVSLVAFAAAFMPWHAIRNRSAPRLREGWMMLRPHLAEVAWVAGVVLAAFILRAFDAGHIPINFGGDEAEMGLQARSFLEGTLNNPFATSWYSHPTMFFFLQSLFLRTFGATVFGLRVFSAVLGTLAVLTSYLLVRQLHSRALAPVTAVLLATYPFHIQFSRLGLNNIADPLWASAVFFLSIRAITTRRIGYFIAAGMALGFSQYFYHGVRLVPVMLAVFLGFWLLQDYRIIVSQIGSLIVMVVAGVLATAPLIFYYLGNPHLFFERYDQQGIIPSGWLAQTAQNTGQSQLAIILDRTRRAFLFYNAIPDNSGFYAPGTPLIGTVSAVLFVFGLAYALYRLKERPYFLFVLWFATGVFTGAVLILDEAGSARLLTTTVPAMFFVALGLFKLVQLATRLLNLHPEIQAQLVAGGVAVIVLLNITFYFVDYTPKRSYSGETGWINTEMAKFLLAQSVAFKAYFFGPPFDYLTHSTIRYMVPGLDGYDVPQPISGPPDFVDRSRRAIFLFIPPRAGEFQSVQRAYPNGERIEFTKPDGQELFFVYEVEQP
jgi:hypothetical protein